MSNEAWSLVILGVGAVGVVIMGWAVLWGDRPRGRLRCPKCWYRMEGIESRKCPECGRTATSDTRLRRTRRRWRGGLLGLTIVVLSVGGAGVILSQQGAWLRAAPTWLLMRIVSEPDYTRAKQLIALRGTPQRTFTRTLTVQGGTTTVTPGPAPARRTRPPITLPGMAAPPPATLPPADFATQLAAELARRHLDGELSNDHRRRLAQRDVQGIDELTLDDLLTYRGDWLDGVVMRPKTHHSVAVKTTVPSTPFEIGLSIVQNGASVTDGETQAYFTNRLSGRPVGPMRILYIEVRKGNTYELKLRVSDAQGEALGRSFPMPITVHDEITDILDEVDDEHFAVLRDHAVRIYHSPAPRGYYIHVRAQPGAMPPMEGLVLESGPRDRPDLMGTARLGRRGHPAWPIYAFGEPLYATPTPDGYHTWPLRLVNDESALLHDPEARHCLPTEGIELDFKALFRPDDPTPEVKAD